MDKIIAVQIEFCSTCKKLDSVLVKVVKLNLARVVNSTKIYRLDICSWRGKEKLGSTEDSKTVSTTEKLRHNNFQG